MTFTIQPKEALRRKTKKSTVTVFRQDPKYTKQQFDVSKILQLLGCDSSMKYIVVKCSILTEIPSKIVADFMNAKLPTNECLRSTAKGMIQPEFGRSAANQLPIRESLSSRCHYM